jgi:hypothetical protein
MVTNVMHQTFIKKCYASNPTGKHHLIMQLLDALFRCIQAPIYPVQNFEHNIKVPMRP